MKIQAHRTRNFTLVEVIHRPGDFPLELLPIAYTALGYVQALRDALWEYFGREIRLEIKSGHRSERYNATLPGAAKNSFHIWRFTPDGQMIWALDLWSPDLSTDELYRFIKDRVRGETYVHKGMGFVHIAPFGPDQEWAA